MNVFLVLLVWGVLILAFVGAFFYIVDAFLADKALRDYTDTPPFAAPAPVPTPAGPERAPITAADRHACNTKGHVIPDWAHHDTWFCVRCDYTAPRHPRDEAPFDQVKAEQLARLEKAWRLS